MSEAPAPVDAAPEQPVQEVNEIGGGGPGENYGADVDAFNDLDGQRPGSDGMDSSVEDSDSMDGAPEGEGSNGHFPDEAEYIDEGTGGDFEESQGDSEGQPEDLEPGSGDKSDEEGPNTPEDDSSPKDNIDSSTDGDGTTEENQSGEGDAEPENNQQTKGSDNNNQGDGPQDNQNKAPSRDKGNQQEKEKSSRSESGKQPIPGDNMLSRLARGEPTEKDLKDLKKDQKKQKSGSAVPKGPWLPKGRGGAKHAQPKESRGPSKLEKYQKEMKTKAKKWDETQTWNNKTVQRAKVQHEEILEGVRKVSKG